MRDCFYRQMPDRERSGALIVMIVAIAGGVIFSAMIFSAPCLLHLGYGRAAFFNYLFFSPICHQLPERSFSLFGYKLAACARCTGIYIGSLAGILFFLAVNRKRLQPPPGKILFFLFSIPMGVEWLLATVGICESSPVLRALTGFLWGSILPLYIVPGILDIMSSREVRGKA